MDRRNFVKCAATGGLVLATTPVFVAAGCNSNWIDVVLTDIPTVVNIANSILQVVSIATGNGVIAAGVSAIITQAVTALAAGLNALKDAVTAYNANKGTGLGGVIAALEAAQNDAKGVLAALPVGTVSATWELVIVAGLGTVVTILSSIQTLVPGAAPAAITAHAATVTVKAKVILPSTDALKAGFNSVLWMNGFAAAEIK